MCTGSDKITTRIILLRSAIISSKPFFLLLTGLRHSETVKKYSFEGKCDAQNRIIRKMAK